MLTLSMPKLLYGMRRITFKMKAVKVWKTTCAIAFNESQIFRCMLVSPFRPTRNKKPVVRTFCTELAKQILFYN